MDNIGPVLQLDTVFPKRESVARCYFLHLFCLSGYRFFSSLLSLLLILIWHYRCGTRYDSVLRSSAVLNHLQLVYSSEIAALMPQENRIPGIQSSRKLFFNIFLRPPVLTSRWKNKENRIVVRYKEKYSLSRQDSVRRSSRAPWYSHVDAVSRFSLHTLLLIFPVLQSRPTRIFSSHFPARYRTEINLHPVHPVVVFCLMHSSSQVFMGYRDLSQSTFSPFKSCISAPPALARNKRISSVVCLTENPGTNTGHCSVTQLVHRKCSLLT